MKNLTHLTLGLAFLFLPMAAFGSEASHDRLDLTDHTAGFIALIIFVIAYALVIFEEQLHLHKSKPVLLAAGLIWVVIAIAYKSHGYDEAVESCTAPQLSGIRGIVLLPVSRNDLY